ncbi:transcriptional regulator, partial [Candidatus Poribacteria bacterium]|nr:transcriptional regulator [Candidatus Poribacteria bacterium]
KGPLDQQIIAAFKFVQKHNEISARKEVGRIDQPQYSRRAVFEAIVNAVVHRDYSKHGSKIRLFMFTDRFELYSPGALANSLTIDKLPYNQATRNELLARLLSEITLDDDVEKQVKRRHFLEGRGEGVGIILNESEQLSGKIPVYELFNEELCLTIFAAKSLQEGNK